MFGNMVFQTYLVAAGAASLREAIKRHGSHRTKRTPCAGLVEHHNDQTQQQRGQHEAIKAKLGTDLKCSRCKPTPRWMSSKWFRYAFLLFFLTMKPSAK